MEQNSGYGGRTPPCCLSSHPVNSTVIIPVHLSLPWGWHRTNSVSFSYCMCDNHEFRVRWRACRTPRALIHTATVIPLMPMETQAGRNQETPVVAVHVDM